MTTVYLAYHNRANYTLSKHADDGPVNLLVSYPFLADFLKVRERFNIGKWSLDSGAYGAWKSGVKVDLDAFITAAVELQPDEVFGLDVINDPDGTKRNLEYMWKEGVPDAIPTFHQGSPWSALEWALSSSEKIAISAKRTKVAEWVLEVFARAWPKKVHGFAMLGKKPTDIVPFDTVDSGSWLQGPASFGVWYGFNRHVRELLRTPCPMDTDFWICVDHFRKLEKNSAWRWRRELEAIR